MTNEEVLPALLEDYALRMALGKKHLPAPEQLIDEIEDLEMSYLTSQVMPALKELADKMLKDVQFTVELSIKKELDEEVVIENEHFDGDITYIYHPKSEDLNINIEAEPNDPQAQHKVGKKGVTKTHIAPKTGLCVYLPDGSIIQEKKACDTFIEAIKLAGLMNVRELGLKYCHVPIVSNTIDNKYGKAQHPVGGGLYILTHSNTKDKKKMLDRISKSLKLSWKVEIVK